MLKKAWFFIEKINGKIVYRLMENVAGTPRPAADPETRPGVIDNSEDLSVITASILRISDVTNDAISVVFEPPEGFDTNKFFPLSGATLLSAREKLGLSPG